MFQFDRVNSHLDAGTTANMLAYWERVGEDVSKLVQNIFFQI